MTNELKCAFSSTLIGDQFACANATPVIRRGGQEFACRSENAHKLCVMQFENLKQAALLELGLEDDLLSIPHSVLTKIQFGGLLGLQRKYGNAGASHSRVDDIQELVTTVVEKCGDLDAVPDQEFVGDITGYRLPRRGRS